MKKFLTLVAALIMAVGASAQDATDPVEETVTWKASDGAPEYTVELKNSKEELVIKAELLNNTSKEASLRTSELEYGYTTRVVIGLVPIKMDWK